MLEAQAAFKAPYFSQIGLRRISALSFAFGGDGFTSSFKSRFQSSSSSVIWLGITAPYLLHPCGHMNPSPTPGSCSQVGTRVIGGLTSTRLSCRNRAMSVLNATSTSRDASRCVSLNAQCKRNVARSQRNPLNSVIRFICSIVRRRGGDPYSRRAPIPFETHPTKLSLVLHGKFTGMTSGRTSSPSSTATRIELSSASRTASRSSRSFIRRSQLDGGSWCVPSLACTHARTERNWLLVYSSTLFYLP